MREKEKRKNSDKTICFPQIFDFWVDVWIIRSIEINHVRTVVDGSITFWGELLKTHIHMKCHPTYIFVNHQLPRRMETICFNTMCLISRRVESNVQSSKINAV